MNAILPHPFSLTLFRQYLDTHMKIMKLKRIQYTIQYKYTRTNIWKKLCRLVLTQTRKKRMNITNSHIVLPITNITPQTAVERVDGMNGNLLPWENTLGVMRYATRATTSSSWTSQKNQRSAKPNLWPSNKWINSLKPFSIVGSIKCILTTCQFGEWSEKCFPRLTI